MNINDYIFLLNNSKGINDKQTLMLESIVQEFPFFQSARALYLKGLYNQESFRYNYELKKAAAHTTDRSVLFDFITSDDFIVFKKENYDKIQLELQSIEVKEFEVVKEENEKREEKRQQNQEITLIDKIENKLEIGKPLVFEKSETHSFSEWLQLSKLAPIEREKDKKELENDSEIEKKFELIEKFIELSPKIAPTKEAVPVPVNIAKSNEMPSSIMTETLAKIYLEQKKYTKAIQAYEILILKYPEKSSFFADRINDIKILQQNN
jgi:tetratricopeptide (TPR) repeat protein